MRPPSQCTACAATAARRRSASSSASSCRWLGKRQGELLGRRSAPACARGLGQPVDLLRDGAQAIVAGHVAELVVDLLEVIDVDHQQRDRLGMLARVLQERDYGIVEMAANVDAGEAVAAAEILQAPVASSSRCMVASSSAVRARTRASR